MDGKDRRQRVQSAEVALRVLSALAEAGRAQPLTALAERVAMPAAKLHRYLQSLISEGFVEQIAVTGHYDLGSAALSVGLAALGRLDVVRLSGEELIKFNQTVNETAFLAVWGNHGPTIVRWQASTRPVTVNVREGSVLPLLCSSTGRVFGAYLPPEVTGPLMAAELAAPIVAKPEVPKTGTEAETLFRTVRARGLATVEGVYLAGVDAASAPVFGHDGRLVAVMTALGPSGSFDMQSGGSVIPALCRSAASISRRLGWVGDESRP